MASYLDSVLFRDTFGTAEMRDVFDDEAYIDRFLAVEAALARAEAAAGVIPEQAAAEISKMASAEHVDRGRLSDLISETGLVSMSIIGAWKPALGDAGEYVHWGATSQDIQDTAAVLQLREALGIVRRDLDAVEKALASIAREYADTPMMGRTHYVHAIPITLGLKAAVWLDEVARHRTRLDQLEERACCLQFFGATGTLASLGEVGLEVQETLAAELDLAVPPVAWQAARDRVEEVVSFQSTVATTLGKIANTVLFLNRPEVAEVGEPVEPGAIGSSTMPHKQNPKRSETILGLSRLVRGLSGVMTEAAGTVDERSASTWYLEFAVVPQAFLGTARMLENAKRVLSDLEVHPDRMAANIDIYGGLVASERILMKLAAEVGRQTAHDILHEDAMAALSGEQSFEEVLLTDDRVTDAIDSEAIATLTDASDYTGLAETFVERTLERHGHV